jgi:protease-4
MKNKFMVSIAALYLVSIVVGIVLIFRKPHCLMTDQIVSSSVFSKDSVAVVEIYGPIYVKEKSSRFGMAQDADAIVRQLHRYSEMKDVKAVILRINSPGGSVAAVQEICDEIHLLKADKKVIVASLGDVAASGGYYIASQADRIYADRGTLTGSIGVILELANVEGLFKKIGVSMKSVQSGKYKDIGSPFREMSADEKKIFQAISDTVYDQFLDAVAAGRKMDREKVKALADGKIYVATQAKDLGLIDDFGNSEKALSAACELAKIQGKPRVLRGETDVFGFLTSLLAEPTEEMRMISTVLAKKKVRLDYMME